ncbi:DinB family protein [Saccharomonospora sp. NPDC006951]
MTTTEASQQTGLTGEYADLHEQLAHQRHFLRFTTRDLTDEQAGLRTTASELCLGGLIKHVTAVERVWVAFARGDHGAMEWDPEDTTAMAERDAEFRMLPGETLAEVIGAYEAVAADTDELLASRPDLDEAHPLPEAPWFEKGKAWSTRRVLLHIAAETAQHAGHADIIREALDGAKSMG